MKFEEDDPFNDEYSAKVVTDFSASLSHFAFKSEEPSTPTKSLRRSPRKPTPRRANSSYAGLDEADSPSSSKKRVYYFDDDEDEKVPIQKNKGSPTKKLKRSYAPPEVYSHLNSLPDHLRSSLDSELYVLEEIESNIEADLVKLSFVGSSTKLALSVTFL